MAGSLYYIIAEMICAIAFNDTPINTYIYHTISELGIPNINSPLSFLMNSAFVLIGITLIAGNCCGLKEYITKNRTLFYVFSMITASGVIIVGLIHGGNPLTSGYHTLGAVMAILGGNILLIITSTSMKEFNEYSKITLILGIVGFIMFWVLFFNMESVYMPVYERLSVYTMILWSFIIGLYLFKS